jgi:hypothetical protein
MVMGNQDGRVAGVYPNALIGAVLIAAYALNDARTDMPESTPKTAQVRVLKRGSSSAFLHSHPPARVSFFFHFGTFHPLT